MAENSKKPRGAPFKAGKSGNPGGRPKLPPEVVHVRQMARLYTEKAIEALVEVLDSDSAAGRVAAANALLDRGWGKAEQVVSGPGENGEHVFTVIERRIVKAND